MRLVAMKVRLWGKVLQQLFVCACVCPAAHDTGQDSCVCACVCVRAQTPIYDLSQLQHRRFLFFVTLLRPSLTFCCEHCHRLFQSVCSRVCVCVCGRVGRSHAQLLEFLKSKEKYKNLGFWKIMWRKSPPVGCVSEFFDSVCVRPLE